MPSVSEHGGAPSSIRKLRRGDSRRGDSSDSESSVKSYTTTKATSTRTATTAAAKHKRTRKNRLIIFLTFWVIKALLTLVILNFYMGSQIPVVQLEDSLAMMMHLDRHKASGGSAQNNILVSKNNATNPQIESNSTMQQNNAIKQPLKGMITPNLADGTLQGKERLWNILTTRNITQVDAEYWATIPTWDDILQNIHHSKGNNGESNSNEASPIIHGLETCQAFRDKTSSQPSQRRIAPAGMFNTGTNYLSVLLEYNCQNPARVEKFGNAKRGHGNEWEVPWGKHTPASSRGKYFKNKNLKYTVDEVLPIVLVRNPYGWMKSTCRNSYTAKWKGSHDQKTCPQLELKEKGANEEHYNPVEVKFGSTTTHHKSLGHLWNDWYGEYFYGNSTENNNSNTTVKRTMDAPFPRLIVRFEDIIFFPYEVTKQICTCAGGVLGHRQDDKDVKDGNFHYVVRSAKAGMGHGPASQRNGLIDSWARYGSSDPKDEYSKEEVEIAMKVLDPLLLDTFGYR